MNSITHHPDSSLLAEYVGAGLPFAQSIAVAAHLHFCNQCRLETRNMEFLAGQLLESFTAPLSAGLLERVLDRIESEPVAETYRTDRGTSGNGSTGQSPLIVDRLLDLNRPVDWHFLTPSLQIARLRTGQDTHEVALHRIRSGGSVAEHDHKGREITVVLSGSFSDEQARYLEGDFVIKDIGDVHTPMATRDTECICLAVSAAPIRLTGPIGWIMNPFFRLHPA